MLRFAVAGTPLSTPSPGGTVLGLKRAAALGIAAMELEWVQRVHMNPDRLSDIRRTAQALNMTLTVHAPYFINLNADDPEKIAASKQRILDAMQAGERAGAQSVCVHAAFYVKKDPAIVLDNVRRATDDILCRARALGITINLAYETMGKPSQFGTLDEVLIISKEFGIYPCLDPAHMHARSNGAWNTSAEWHEMLDRYEQFLGSASLQKMHIHYSGIEYSGKGERRHVPLLQSDAQWQEFLRVLRQRGIGGVVVCESPTLEDDTLRLQEEYDRF